MIKKEIYPKTIRIKTKNLVTITEKMDGSNLGIFNKDGQLLICTRERIFTLEELKDNKECKDLIKTYRGLFNWLGEYGEDLRSRLYINSGIFVEWMGAAGHVSYPDGIRGHKCYMFAKARITEDYDAERINYDHELFKYPFVDEIIPDYIDVVPIVTTMDHVPTVSELDKLYEEYSLCVKRNVEGFVVNTFDTVRKYVRMKRGKLEPHHE